MGSCGSIYFDLLQPFKMTRFGRHKIGMQEVHPRTFLKGWLLTGRQGRERVPASRSERRLELQQHAGRSGEHRCTTP